MKRMILIAILVVGLIATIFAARMAMAVAGDQVSVTVKLTVPTMLQIVGLDGFSLTGTPPGTMSGSDTNGFQVIGNVTWTGTVVCGDFSGVAASTAETYTPYPFQNLVAAGTTDCTVGVSVVVAATDTVGIDKEATLTVTVTGSS